jgi:hypothetical protein
VKKLFEKDDRVTPQLIDWYKFAEETEPKVESQKYDVVFFGFSFMLMPDPVKVRIQSVVCVNVFRHLETLSR